MRTKNLRDFVYVCPHCINPLRDCVCDAYPMKLIQLDRNIWPIVKVLNEKWYVTDSCCEGHIDSNHKIYIGFARRYHFTQPIPKGFSGNGFVLCADISAASVQAIQRKKRRLLNALYDWACELETQRPEGGIVALRDF